MTEKPKAGKAKRAFIEAFGEAQGGGELLKHWKEAKLSCSSGTEFKLVVVGDGGLLPLSPFLDDANIKQVLERVP